MKRNSTWTGAIAFYIDHLQLPKTMKLNSPPEGQRTHTNDYDREKKPATIKYQAAHIFVNTLHTKHSTRCSNVRAQKNARKKTTNKQAKSFVVPMRKSLWCFFFHSTIDVMFHRETW